MPRHIFRNYNYLREEWGGSALCGLRNLIFFPCALWKMAERTWRSQRHISRRRPYPLPKFHVTETDPVLQDLEEARRYRARLAAVARAVQHTYHEHASRGGEDGRAEMGEKRKRAIDEDRGHDDSESDDSALWYNGLDVAHSRGNRRTKMRRNQRQRAAQKTDAEKVPDDRTYIYVDANGQCQGPHSLSDTQRWASLGWFPSAARVCVLNHGGGSKAPLGGRFEELRCFPELSAVLPTMQERDPGRGIKGEGETEEEKAIAHTAAAATTERQQQ